MASEAAEIAKAAVRPDLDDLRIASEVILAELAKGALVSTTNLVELVRLRLEAEPQTVPADLLEPQVRIAKAIGTTIVALAHLESTGHVLPFGGKWMPATQRYSPELTLMIPNDRNGRGYRVGDQFNYELSEVYVLPQTGLAIESDSPAVFLSGLPGSMGPKVQRVLREAADAYRSGLFVGTAVLLATASEAAWEQLARKLANDGEAAIAALLASPTARTAELQLRSLEALRKRRAAPPGVLAVLETTTTAYRDLRNHAAHEPESRFDEKLFSRSNVSNLLAGATFYFRQLYGMHDRTP